MPWKVRVCWGEDQSRGRGNSGPRPDFGSRHSRGQELLQAPLSHFFARILLTDWLLETVLLVDEMRLRHMVSIWKATSDASQKHRVRCCACKLGNSQSQNHRAVLELESSLHLILITMLLLSGP